MAEFCKVEKGDGVVTVTIDRPEVMNAIHPPANFELEQIFQEFESSDSTRVAILTGAGDKAFSAGNDLKYMAEGNPVPIPELGFAGLTANFTRTKPVIAAVNGFALGGGFEIALACDLIIAADSACFGLPEPKVGLAALAGGLQRLPRQIGLKQALGVILTGRNVTAEEGLRMGFVNEIVPRTEVMAAARRWAALMLECSPVSIKTSIDVVRRSLDDADLEHAIRTPYDSVKALRSSDDFVEGPRAFAAKRKPNWA